jgi:hypothetical protein
VSCASVSNNSKREVSVESDEVKVRDMTLSHLKHAHEWCKFSNCTRIYHLGPEYRILVHIWPIESISPKKGDIVRPRA